MATAGTQKSCSTIDGKVKQYRIHVFMVWCVADEVETLSKQLLLDVKSYSIRG